MSTLAETAAELATALKTKDRRSAASFDSQLLKQASTALLYQEKDELEELRQELSSLANVADDHAEALGGDRYRALVEVAAAFQNRYRPAEQARLAAAKGVAGKMLRRIMENPGITPKELAAMDGNGGSAVSGPLAKLYGQGLIRSVVTGRQHHLFATETSEILVGESVGSAIDVSAFTCLKEKVERVPAKERTNVINFEIKKNELHLRRGQEQMKASNG